MTRIVLDIDDTRWKVDHLARVMASANSEFLSELAAQVDIQVTDARPLIVLDIEDPAGAAKDLRKHSGLLVVKIADQIEAQTKPARIPEPGLWGVVKASTDYDHRRLSYLHDDLAPGMAAWSSAAGRIEWSRLIDPTLIREGVES